MSRAAPRRAGLTESSAILAAAQAATDLSQVQFARRILDVNDRSYRGWLAGEPCWGPVTRLAWLIARHPELAAEIEAEFGA
jgi:hypothetical protein